jgi:zinc transporter 1/2/3
MNKTDILKIISFISILALGLIFSFIPNYVNSIRKNEYLLDIANTFAAGLFLGIGLLHLLPESSEIFKDQYKIKFPIAYLISFLTYCLILCIEKVIFDPHSIIHEHNKLSDNNLKKDIDENIISEPLVQDNSLNDDFKSDIHLGKNKLNKNLLQPFILLFALGFHAIFEGIALGILDDFNSVLSLMLVILAHKWAEGLTFGISFLKSELSKCQINTFLIIFSMMGPFGVLFGMFLSAMTNKFIQGIFLAASSGTFLYIACSEVITEQFEKKDNRVVKFICILIGGGFTAVLAYFE